MSTPLISKHPSSFRDPTVKPTKKPTDRVAGGQIVNIDAFSRVLSCLGVTGDSLKIILGRAHVVKSGATPKSTFSAWKSLKRKAYRIRALRLMINASKLDPTRNRAADPTCSLS